MSVDYRAPLFQHPRQTWDAAKCGRLAKRIARDGLGTRYPFPGFLPYGADGFGHYAHGLVVRYNGGIVRDGQWWQGEQWPLPDLAPGFRIVQVTNWGHRIIRDV